MQYQIRECENWRYEIDVKFPAQKVFPKLEERYRQYQKQVKMEGFRKGKTPLSLVKKMFGKKVQDDIVDSFVQEAFAEIREKENFNFLSYPEVKNIKFDSNEGLSFIIYFDVRPEFTVSKYKGIKVEKEVYEVASEDVDKYVEELRQENAMVYTVDQDAKLGHILNVDLQQLDRTGVPIVGKKYDNRVVELKSDDEVLTPQLLGIKAGETRKVRIPVENESLTIKQRQDKNQEEIYNIKVNSVTERRLPDLDDELAKDVGNFETLEELRDNIEKKLKFEYGLISQQKLAQDIADEVIKDTKLDIPQTMLDLYLDAIITEVKKDRDREKKKDEEIREEAKAIAIRNLKWLLIKEKIAQSENINVTEEELEAAINSLRNSGGDGVARANRYMRNKKARENFKNELLEQKIINFLINNANIREVKIKDKQESNLAI